MRRSRAIYSRFILGVALALAVTGAAMADASVAQGRAFAQQNCARCHAIAGPGPSAVRKAPPFSSFGQHWSLEDVAEALAEGIIVGHGSVRMPEFSLQTEQIDDLMAYLESVQR